MALLIDYYGVSVTGRRSENQDAFLAEKLSRGSYVFAVADGMGGTNGGELASKFALNSLFAFLSDLHSSGRSISPKKALEEAFSLASEILREEKSLNPDLNNMGTTLSVLYITKNRFYIGHIGDSRIYKITDNQIEQITEDHTYIQDYQNKHQGKIPTEIAEKYGHYLLKVLDGDDDVFSFYPKRKEDSLLSGISAFLLCSDGLILDKVHTNHNLFKNYILGSKSPKSAAEALVNYAFHLGSGDNITALVINIGGDSIRKDLNLREFPAFSAPDNIEQKTSKQKIKMRFWKYWPYIILFIGASLVAGLLLLKLSKNLP